MKKHLPKIFSKYLLVGIANTVTSIFIIIALISIGVSDEISNFFGIACGIFQSIVLNTRFTFRQKNLNAYKSLNFLIILILAYLINLITLYISKNYLGLNSVLSQIAGLSSYVLASFYLLEKYLFTKQLEK
jgi:putative flippase GtrA